MMQRVVGVTLPTGEEVDVVFSLHDNVLNIRPEREIDEIEIRGWLLYGAVSEDNWIK